MKKKKPPKLRFSILITGTLFLLFLVIDLIWLWKNPQAPTETIKDLAVKDIENEPPHEEVRQKINLEYKNTTPEQWSETSTGIKTKLDTDKKVIALTLDACGGKNGDGFDSNLIDFLVKNNIPATLFIGGRWIDANQKTFLDLSKNPLFEIENHGLNHKPCSINGKKAFGISGENNPGEVADEIELNNQKIFKLIGKQTKFYRPGTGFSDEICPQIAEELGHKVVNYDLTGDGGAKFSTTQAKNSMLKAKPGSIIIAHMNHPEKDSSKGVIEGILELKKSGYEFVKLKDYNLK